MKIIMILILFLTIGCNKNPEVIEQKENIEQKITEKDSNKNLEIYKQIKYTDEEVINKGFYEDEYETLEYDNNIIILKNNVKISGENEKIIYNSIEEHIIRDYEIYEFINKKD